MPNLDGFIGKGFILFIALMQKDTGDLNDADHAEEEVDSCEKNVSRFND